MSLTGHLDDKESSAGGNLARCFSHMGQTWFADAPQSPTVVNSDDALLTMRTEDYFNPPRSGDVARYDLIVVETVIPERRTVALDKFNVDFEYPYELRQLDFQGAMQDVYDFFHDVNTHLRSRGLQRLDDMLRPANMSGILTDMLTASLGKHARVLVPNKYPNGHPDLVVAGHHPGDAAQSADRGVEVKTTRKVGGAVDVHGARRQTMCVFAYAVDTETEPAESRHPMRFTEVYLGVVEVADFRKNARGELGTRTATLHAAGIKKLRESWVYLDK